MPEIRLYVERAPNGLAGALARGEVPSWLTAVAPTSPTPFRIYRVD
jgi:hypothetical protein